jgi:hypothetical protein
MNWLQRNPLLGAVLLACTLALAAEGWLLAQARQQAARALVGLEQKQQERDWLGRQSPAPSEANEQAIERDFAQAVKVWEDLRTALQGRDPKILETPPPAKPTDAYFDIAAFVEKMRATAARARVMIKPDERFGFATHSNEGPEADLVPAVFRQRLVSQYLVEALLEARPRVLVSVQRERPLTAAQRDQRNQPGQANAPAAVTPAPGGVAADFFEFDAPSSLRVPGRVESMAFRLEFTGQTPALRAFLNNLAALPLPVIVRRVEVEPLAGEVAPTAALAPGAPVPLVTQNLSKFAVVVECVELLTASERSVL